MRSCSHGAIAVRLRVGTLAKALAGLLALFVGIPLAVMLVPEGQMKPILFGASIACAAIACLKPKWGQAFFGVPPAFSWLVVAFMGCDWARSLAGLPEVARTALGLLMVAALVGLVAVARKHQGGAQAIP